jgi:Protein of unknown function (DUF4236)
MGGRTRLELRQQPAEREDLGGFFCFRLGKRISLGKFLHVNLSKSGASLSVGRRGATVSIGRRGTTAHVRHSQLGRELFEADRQAPTDRRPLAARDRDRGRGGHRSSLMAVRALTTLAGCRLFCRSEPLQAIRSFQSAAWIIRRIGRFTRRGTRRIFCF